MRRSGVAATSWGSVCRRTPTPSSGVHKALGAQQLADHTGGLVRPPGADRSPSRLPGRSQELLAHYVMTVKINTPKLYTELDALNWAAVEVQHETT